MKYVIVTPVRNEEGFVAHTLESVVSQTSRPAKWVIVDDGSVDGTARIVQEYVDKYPWIELVRLEDRGFRMPGEGVVRAFYAGLGTVDSSSYDFIVKLDGDLALESDYFARLFRRFDENPELGIAGGGCYVPRGNHWVLERSPRDHVRGLTKVYRRECFEDIGGLEAVGGWDAIDDLRAQMKGWETRSFAELKVRQYRPTGTAESKLVRMAKSGEFSYYRGYPPLVMLLRGIYRALTDRPFIFGGFAMLWGYLRSWLMRQPQIDDPELISYYRQKMLRRLAIWRHLFSGERDSL
jgi:biofilm PGA synthesis N-glycosyltransferase PgaC